MTLVVPASLLRLTLSASPTPPAATAAALLAATLLLLATPLPTPPASAAALTSSPTTTALLFAPTARHGSALRAAMMRMLRAMARLYRLTGR